MRLFGRKAGGSSARPALLRSMTGTIANGDWPRSYEAQVREAYLGNPVAQRAARLVAEGGGGGAGRVARDKGAGRWNQALRGDAARAAGGLWYDPGGEGAALSGEQLDRLKAEMEASFSGTANAGRPMLLEGGLKWQAMSLTP